jgi:hypothetical protein
VISYQAGIILKLLHCNDPTCAGGDDSVTIADNSDNLGRWNSLALDNQGRPVVGYEAQTYQGTPMYDVRVLHCFNQLCTAGPDLDLDGCHDVEEDGDDETLGGLRNPKIFWDFFDTPNASNTRDKAVASADLFRVLDRFGATGDPMIDPLSAPPPAPAYHTAFDRGPSSGPNPWNLTAANGSIASTDFFAALAQFGHSCA